MPLFLTHTLTNPVFVQYNAVISYTKYRGAIMLVKAVYVGKSIVTNTEVNLKQLGKLNFFFLLLVTIKN